MQTPRAGLTPQTTSARSSQRSGVNSYPDFIRHLRANYGDRLLTRNQGTVNNGGFIRRESYTIFSHNGNLQGSDGVFVDDFDKLKFRSRFNYDYTVSKRYNGENNFVKVQMNDNPLFIDRFQLEIPFKVNEKGHAQKAAKDLQLGQNYLFVQGLDTGAGTLDYMFEPLGGGGSVVFFTKEGLAFQTNSLNKDLAVIPVTLAVTEPSNHEQTIAGITEQLNYGGFQTKVNDIRRALVPRI